MNYKVDNAIILAAGIGSRFTPISLSQPKGLVKVYGECMVERQIKHLLDAGISDITLVTGYLAEQFEYLKQKYAVKCVFNPYYASKNNIASLNCVKDRLNNTYILSSDNYMNCNIYSMFEPHSWYSCVFANSQTTEWCVDTDIHDRITHVTIGGNKKWYMYGSVFLDETFSSKFMPLLEHYSTIAEWNDKYWEDVFAKHIHDLPPIYIRKFSDNIVYEFENLDELRAFDRSYLKQSNNPLLSEVSRLLNTSEDNLLHFAPYDRSNTAKVFKFDFNGITYIAKLNSDMNYYPFETITESVANWHLLHIFKCG